MKTSQPPLHIEVLHGPNLNLLGERERALYGQTALVEIDAGLAAVALELSVSIDFFQSNHEGALIDRLHATRGRAHGYIFNPAGYTHTSVALRDAVLAVAKPVIEVHLSNPSAREPFRRVSLLSDVALGSVVGLGGIGYELALRGLVCRLRQSDVT